MSSRGRPKHPDILTPREWEVLGHIREGRSNEQIAERLGISIDGVKYHVSEILGKLALDNRHDAARWAEGQSPRPWPAVALAPLLFWRKLKFGWLPPVLAGGLLVAVAAGLGLLVWGLLATRGGDEATGDGQPIFADIEAVRLAAGRRHTCAVTPVGGVKCWGDNSFGQLGDGTDEGPRTTPVDVVGLDSGVAAVTAGYSHTCALMSAGTVKCWGFSRAGRFSVDTKISSSYTPVDVTLPEGPVTSLSAGYRHTCAVISGRVFCWGGNDYGQLGRGTTDTGLDPGRVEDLNGIAVSVSAGRYFTCAALASGEAKCWGQNAHGQIGGGILVSGRIGSLELGNAVLDPTVVVDENGGALANVRMVVAGDYAHACALTANGAVLCWGSSVWCEVGDGQCGEGRYYTSVAVKPTGLESGVIGLAVGGTQGQGGHSCAIDSSGRVFCWGRGYEGQLGDGRDTSDGNCKCVPPGPVAVVGLDAPAIEIASGGRHNCAILENEEIVCWGDNEFGQLGAFDLAESAIPVSITGFGNSD
ncbi:MAG: hypothetical protein IIC91_15045 [Chloroflexi bacterium]|nr:hypothetical protein [Chloroflexota bacterium]